MADCYLRGAGVYSVNGIARLGRASQDSAMKLEITMVGHNSISTLRT